MVYNILQQAINLRKSWIYPYDDQESLRFGNAYATEYWSIAFGWNSLMDAVYVKIIIGNYVF